MEHPCEGGKKIYINGQGHMTKMAAMAINRKKPLKIFSRTRRPMILKLGVKHAMELYKVYINHDHGMTLTFFRQGQLRSPMHLNGKNRKISFNGRKLARNEQMDRKFMFMKIFWAQGRPGSRGGGIRARAPPDTMQKIFY